MAGQEQKTRYRGDAVFTYLGAGHGDGGGVIVSARTLPVGDAEALPAGSAVSPESRTV